MKNNFVKRLVILDRLQGGNAHHNWIKSYIYMRLYKLKWVEVCIIIIREVIGRYFPITIIYKNWI